jgi:hypothetical protein
MQIITTPGRKLKRGSSACPSQHRGHKLSMTVRYRMVNKKVLVLFIIIVPLEYSVMTSYILKYVVQRGVYIKVAFHKQSTGTRVSEHAKIRKDILES